MYLELEMIFKTGLVFFLAFKGFKATFHLQLKIDKL
jgi:hypothetical protein